MFPKAEFMSWNSFKQLFQILLCAVLEKATSKESCPEENPGDIYYAGYFMLSYIVPKILSSMMLRQLDLFLLN